MTNSGGGRCVGVGRALVFVYMHMLHLGVNIVCLQIIADSVYSKSRHIAAFRSE